MTAGRLAAAVLSASKNTEWNRTHDTVWAARGANAILAADPDLAGDIELGAAWARVLNLDGDMVQLSRPSPDGGGIRGLEGWTAEAWFPRHGHDSRTGPTPAAALASLADALEARER